MKNDMNKLNLSELLAPITVSIINQMELCKKGMFSSIPRIVGPPGMGKSDFCKQLVSHLEGVTKSQWGLVVHYLGTFPLEKMTGLPLNIKESDDEMKSEGPKFAKWSCPDIFDFKTLEVPVKDYKKPYNILMLLDDIHLVKSNMAPYLYQLYSYRTIHGYKMPDNVVLISAGNGKDDNAGFQKTQNPIINREVYFQVKCDVDQWTRDYAIQANVKHEIISYLNHDPSMMHTKCVNSEPFATPRSWVSLSDQMKIMDNINIDKNNIDILYNISAGTVGTTAASNFIEYIELIYKWNAGKILKGDENINYNDLDKIDAYSLLSACVGEFIKMFRNPELLEDEDLYVDNMKSIIVECSKKHKPIIPVVLGLIVKSEGSILKSTKVSRKILDANMTDIVNHMVN